MQKLKHYFLIALRNFRRNALHTTINVTGLSIGIAACLVIFLIVRHEMGFDRHHADGDRIYRVYSRFTGVFEGTNRGVPSGLAGFLEEELTDYEAVAPFFTVSMPVSAVEADGRVMDRAAKSEAAIVSPRYFDVFPDYEWLSGKPEEVLSQPGRVVLTDEKARLYFGVDHPLDAVGRELRYRDSLVLTVGGVVKKQDRPTDLIFSDFISYATVRNTWLKNNYRLDDWGSTNSSTQLFVKLKEGTSPAAAQENLKLADEKYAAQNDEWGFIANYQLQPLRDLHFNAEIGIFDQTKWSPAHRPTLHLLMLIAALLLLIAAVNFINLETAQSFRRAKEVGVRKVLGGSRRELMWQFLLETFFLTLIAVVVSLVLADWALRYFDDFVPDALIFNPLAPGILLFLLGLAAAVCVLAGTYPAFVLSSFKPVHALKDRLEHLGRNAGGVNLRRGLVVFQFFIAQALIFGALTIGRQIDFMLEKDLGFSKDAIVCFYTPWRDTTNRKVTLAQELKRLPEIAAVSRYDAPPAENGWSTSIIKFQRGDEELSHNVYRKFGDTAYIKLFDMELFAGRNVLHSDTVKEFVINETYARQLGFEAPEEAIDQRVNYDGTLIPIVGVVKDFHLQSLHKPIEPVIIADNSADFSGIGLKIRTAGGRAADFEPAIAKVEQLWKQFYPDETFDYEFMDETLASFYETEKRVAKMTNTATAVAILISCLGLLGLVSFTAFQRTKEIGIRKVLGAEVKDIVLLLTSNFLLLVFIAFVLAIPVSWWATHRWLQDFAFRVGLEWWTFVAAGLGAMVIAFLTVSFHSVRAATANPVEALRSE